MNFKALQQQNFELIPSLKLFLKDTRMSKLAQELKTEDTVIRNL